MRLKKNMLSLHARGLLSKERLTSALDALPPSNIAPIYTYLVSDQAQSITGKLYTCSGKHLGSFHGRMKQFMPTEKLIKVALGLKIP